MKHEGGGPVGAVVVVDRRGAVTFASGRARALLHEYIGETADSHLPPTLVDWLGRALRDWSGPFTIQRDTQRLVIRIVVSSDPEQAVLSIEEQYASRSELRGLTPRESEVLWWVTEGKTNREIGIILGRSARTVQIHLNNVYRKLGVETRTAAAILALRASLGRDAAVAS
jgi:DNA-binding CsgD family transcriptional regulator